MSRDAKAKSGEVREPETDVPLPDAPELNDDQPTEDVTQRLDEQLTEDVTRNEAEGGVINAARTKPVRAPVSRRPARRVRLGSHLPARGLQRGDEIGEFLILDEIGAGGMGEVFAAYDPNLDRKVAIKLLSEEAAGKRSRARARQRLLREAQAMARISHPGVITVHQVGIIGEHIFLAMEYASGGTLKEWLRGGDRSWQEIVEVFVQCGHGLAAAHDVGLVHRDFKPQNVLFDEHGRARVTDFGLVGVVNERGQAASDAVSLSLLIEDEQADSQLPTHNPLRVSLTRTGAVLGTPRYMAPEQHAGGLVDARADQFSFCASLFEALYKKPPFAGATTKEIAANIQAGNLRNPSGHEVPAWLASIVRRGLSIDPNERYPSMRALLDSLGREQAPRRRKITTAAFALAIAGALGLALWAAHDSRNLCQGAERRLAGVWGPEQKESVRAALTASQQPFALDTYRRVEVVLDSYRAAWSAGYKDACEATHVHGDQSEALLDSRMRCLRRRLREMKSLVGLLGKGGDILHDAVRAASALPSLGACADVAALGAAVPPPADKVARRQVNRLEDRLAEVKALNRLGAYAQGLELATALVGDAEAVGYRPIEAEILAQASSLSIRAGRHKENPYLERALRAAAEVKNDTLLARVLTDKVTVLGELQAHYDAAAEAGQAAELACLRADGDVTDVRAHLAMAIGRVHESRGEYGSARDSYLPALAALEEHPDHDELTITALGANLGKALQRLGQFDTAKEHYEQVLATRQRILGPEHPDVAAAFQDLGALAIEQGLVAKARDYVERALALRRRSLGENHRLVAETLISASDLAADEGNYQEALTHAQRALEIRRAALGDRHPTLAKAHIAVGNAYAELHQFPAAMQHFESALAILEATASEHPRIAWVLNNIGTVLIRQREYDRARVFYERGIAIIEEKLGPDHATMTDVVGNLAIVHKAQKRYDDAERMYLQALRILKKAHGDGHPNAGLFHYNLGNLAMSQDADAKAHGHYLRAVAILEGALGPEHVYVGRALMGVGATHTELGRHPQAVTALERALTVIESATVSRSVVGEARLLLARALWPTGRQRKRAVEMAQKARDDFAADNRTDDVERVATWLREHRLTGR